MIPMPWRKKLDRGGVRAGDAPGVDRGRGGTLPDPPLSRRALAAAGPAAAVSPRLSAPRHREATDALPSGEREGARQGRAPLHECGAASVARSGAGADPRGLAGADGDVERRGEPASLGTLAGGTDGADHPAGG